MTAATIARQLDGENPWPGLESFKEDSRAFFYGRDQQAESLLKHVLDAPVTVLYGRSGLGKTSLLRAGLFPLLRDHRFLPVYVRFELKLGAVPLTRQLHQSVRDSIRADVADAMLPLDDESLWEYLHRADFELWSADNYPLTPVIVLDQFEELFTLGERVPNLVREFMNDLGDLAENRIPADLAARIDDDGAVAERFNLRSRNYKLLISLREDFLPELEEWCRLIPALARSRLRLLRLRAGDALDAVHKPAAHLMTDELARRVVGIIAGEDLHPGRDTASTDAVPGDELGAAEVEPALLSLFCRELNEERKRRGQLQFDERLVEDAKRDILSNYYSSCVSDLPHVAEFIEEKLISEKGFRDSFIREDAVPTHLTEDELAQLISSRLLRLEDRYGAQRIELTHDVLTRVVREHRDRRRAEEEKAALASRVEEERQAAAQRQAELDRERRVGRRLRWLSAVLAMVCVAAVVLAVVAMKNSRSAALAREAAEGRSRDAVANDLVAEGLNKLSNLGRDRDDLAMQLILAARTFPSNNPVEYPILSALQTERDLLKLIDAHAWVKAVAYSPDGHRIAAAAQRADHTVQIWDADTGQPAGPPLRGHDKHVMSVAYSPDGHRIATASADKTVRIWDADTRQPVGPPLRGHDDVVNAVAYSPDGHRIATASADKTVRIWDPDTGQPVGAPMRHDKEVLTVAFSPDGHLLASGGMDNLRRWDIDTAQLVGEPLLSDQPGVVATVAFSPDGHRLAAGGLFDFAVYLFDADSGRPAGQLTGHTGAVNSVVFSPDGHTIATGSDDRTVRLWDAKTSQPVGPPLSGHQNAVMSVAFSPHGKRLLSGAFDDTVRVWDTITGRPLAGHEDFVTRVAFSPDGHRIASASADKTVRLWDAQTRQSIGAPLTGHEEWVMCVVYSPDGRRLATASADKTVRIWDADTGQPIGQPLRGHDDAVMSVAFSPDGRRLATASADKTVRIWDADSLAPIGDPLKHDETVIAAVFSPDGQHIATSSMDETMRLWDARTGHLLTGPVHHDYQDMQLGFSPDGHRIIAGSLHNTVPLWDAQTLKPSGDPLGFGGGWVLAAAFSPDGKTIAATSNDGTVQLWNAHGISFGPALTGHTAAVNSVAFSPDSRTIVTGSVDKTLRLWPVPTMSPDAVCAKLTQNMSHKEWDFWLPNIHYHPQCPGLPTAES
jgi:WD40 repeat protein